MFSSFRESASLRSLRSLREVKKLDIIDNWVLLLSSSSPILNSTTNPTSGSASRRHALSSSDESTSSRIQSADPFRIGGPLSLPDFPLESCPLDSTDSLKQHEALILDIASRQLVTRNISYQNMALCKRCPAGQSFIESDQTLLTMAPRRLDNLWVVAIDEMLTEYSQNGIRGRIEIIDPMALFRKTTYPSDATEVLGHL
jgi:hypothetical protein